MLLIIFLANLGIVSSYDASTLGLCWFGYMLMSNIDLLLASSFSAKHRHVFIRCCDHTSLTLLWYVDVEHRFHAGQRFSSNHWHSLIRWLGLNCPSFDIACWCQTLISCWRSFFHPIISMVSSALRLCWCRKHWFLAGKHFFSPSWAYFHQVMRPHWSRADIASWIRKLISCWLAFSHQIKGIFSSGA